MPDVFMGWHRLADDDDLQGVDPWIGRHLVELVAQETAAAGAADGTTLLHADIRADNVLITPTDVMFVDWPWASRGAAWIDLLLMLPSVAMQRGPRPWEIFDTLPTLRAFQRDQGLPALEWLKRRTGWI